MRTDRIFFVQWGLRESMGQRGGSAMAVCPEGHDSASDDFCDVCGTLIDGSPAWPGTQDGEAPRARAPRGERRRTLLGLWGAGIRSVLPRVRFRAEDPQAVCPPCPAGRAVLVRLRRAAIPRPPTRPAAGGLPVGELIIRAARIAVPTALQTPVPALGPEGAVFVVESCGTSLMEAARAAAFAVEPSGASASLLEPSGIVGRAQRPDRAASTARPAGGAQIIGGFRGYRLAGISILTGPSAAPRTVLISCSRSAAARGPVRVGARGHGSA